MTSRTPLAYRRLWKLFSTAGIVPSQTKQLAVIKELSTTLLTATDPDTLSQVWKSGIPFHPGGDINWQRFADELITRSTQ